MQVRRFCFEQAIIGPYGLHSCWQLNTRCAPATHLPACFRLGEVQFMCPSTTHQYELQQVELRQLGDDLQKRTPGPNGKCECVHLHWPPQFLAVWVLRVFLRKRVAEKQEPSQKVGKCWVFTCVGAAPLPCCIQRAAGLQNFAHLNCCSTAMIHFYYFLALVGLSRTSWKTPKHQVSFLEGAELHLLTGSVVPSPFTSLSKSQTPREALRVQSDGWWAGKAVEGKPSFHVKRSETFEGSHSSPSICTWVQLREVDLSASPALSVACSNSCSESSSHWSDFYWRCFSIVVHRMLPSFLFLLVSFLLNTLFVINLWYVYLLGGCWIQF